MAENAPDPTLFPSTMAFSGLAQQSSSGTLERLAQYRIVKPLGRGGMGVVYQAEDTQLNRMAALKVMRADYAADPEALARFIREAQAAAQLKHDHIVTIYQVGQENGTPFLAMEFLVGKSLEEWLRPDRRATIVEALLISKQIARGLAAAHAADLIHRDIKPANLWLEAPRGRVKILDFGLARHTAGEHPALTQDGSVVGTPAFMAPEQARGDVVDHRCDLFSLGCVMYRMITGRLPFQGTTTYAVLSAIAAETPPSPICIRSEIPQRLSDLVDQLLAKKAEQRPASAQAVLDELTAIEKLVKQPPSPPSLLNLPPAAILPVAALPSGTPRSDMLPSDTLPPVLPTVRLARPARRKGKNHSVVYIVLGVVATAVVLVGLLALLINSEMGLPRQQPIANVPRPHPPVAPVVEPARLTQSTGEKASPAASVAPIAVVTTSLTPLSELNSPDDDCSPWVSRDGLEIYFTREKSGQAAKTAKTYRATRDSINDPFGPPKFENSLSHAVLSADGLVMVGLQGDDGGSERLFQTSRAGTQEAFPAAKAIESLQGKLRPRYPWLSTNGLRLTFQRTDQVGDYAGKMSPQTMRQTEFVQCRRDSLRDDWSQPVRLPLTDHSLYTDALTQPSLSEDHLMLFFCNGTTHFSEVMYATRATEEKSFANPQKVMVDGQALIGRSPRYVAATRELYLVRNNGTRRESKDLDLWWLHDFVPKTSDAASARPPKKPD